MLSPSEAEKPFQKPTCSWFFLQMQKMPRLSFLNDNSEEKNFQLKESTRVIHIGFHNTE